MPVCVASTIHRHYNYARIVRYLESKQRVQFLKQNNQMYITLTRIGKWKYKEKLKELIELKFSASSQNKKLEIEGQTLSPAKV